MIKRTINTVKSTGSYITGTNVTQQRNFSYRAGYHEKISPHYDPKKHMSVVHHTAVNKGGPANRLTHLGVGQKGTSGDVIDTHYLADCDLNGKKSPKGTQNIAVIDAQYTKEQVLLMKMLPQYDHLFQDGMPMTKILNNIFGYSEDDDWNKIYTALDVEINMPYQLPWNKVYTSMDEDL